MNIPGYLALLIASTVVMLSLAVIIWHRPTPGSRTFSLLLVSISIWSLFNVFEVIATDLETKILFSKMLYLGVVTVPPLWLIFMLKYTGQTRWLTRTNGLVIWLFPLVTLALVWTNEFHNLVWARVLPISADPGAQLKYEHGLWFSIWAIYSYTTFFLGVTAIVFALLQFPRVYRHQMLLILVAAVMPLLINVVYLAGYTGELDPTPIGFTFSGLIISYTLLHFRLFNVVPVARSTLFDSMSDGVMVVDSPGNIVDINRAALEMLGIEEMEIVGKPVEVGLEHYKPYLKRFAQVEEIRTEIEIGPENDKKTFVDLRISPIKDHKDHLIGRVVVFHDSSDRKLAENALRDSEAMYHALVNNMAVAVFMKDLNGVYTYVNRFCSELNRSGVEVIIGKNDYDLHPKDLADLFHETDLDVIQTGQPYEAEELLDPPVDGTKYIHIIKFPVHDKNGKIAGIQGVYWDVTKTKENEETLRRQAEQFATLNRAMQALSSTLNLRAVLDGILRELRKVVPYDSASVFEIKGDHIELIGGYGFPNLDELLGIHFGVNDENTPSTIVLRTNAPYILPNAPEKYPAFNEGKHAAARIHGWMGIPLLYGNKATGMLSLDKHEIDFYTPEQAELALIFASQAAIAIQNAHLYERERTRVLRESILFGIGQLLAGLLEEEEIWQGLVEGLYNEELGYVYIVSYELNKDKKRKIMRGNVGWVEAQVHTFISTGTGLSDYPFQSGHPHYTPDVSKDTLYVPGLPEGCEADIPIKAGDEIVGVLCVQSPIIGGFTQEDIDTFMLAANQAGLALSKARLLKETQQRLAEIASLQDQLREQAIRDPLTGLYNRRYLDETLDREFRRAERDQYEVSLAMLDLDHFKRVNDTFGHKVGDLLLQKLSDFLRAQSRSSDVTCRYGGEEFIVVLPNTTGEVVAIRADQWRMAFEELYVIHEGKKVQTTISIGIATYPIHGEHSEEILIKADTAMYHAKQTGRNQVIVYDESLSSLTSKG